LRRVKGAVAVLAMTALAGGAGACGSSSDDAAGSSTAATSASQGVKKPDAKTIGYVDIMSAGAMQKRWFNYFKAASDTLGWKVIDQSANGVGSAGLKAVQAFVQQGVDAIVVSCIDTGVLRPGLVAAKRANIPVVALGCQNGPPDDAWDATYAEDDQALAEKLASHVVAEFHQQGVTKASVLQDRTILVGRLRSDYFINALKRAGIELVSTPVIPETSIAPSTTQAIKSTLQAHPDTKAFIPVFDFSVGPGVQALKSLGSSAKGVGIYTYYADQVNLPLMLKTDSPIKGVVDGPVEQVSLVAVDQLLRHFNTGKPLDPDAGKQLKVDYVIFTPKNAPKATPGYVTPFPVGTYLAPFVQRWNSEFHYQLSVPTS
jgi:ABC-type sugar transport system substrate-binding protein